MAFHVMLKPHGAACNLQCAYCFFLPKRQTLNSTGRMSDWLLERFVQQYIAAQPPGLVVFTWQGGEPTLAGLDFFQRAVDLQKKHCPPDKCIANDLQTNGTLLDDKWCAFLKENEFLVGISIDGPADLHNCYRTTLAGDGSWAKTLAACRLLKKYAIPFNTLTVLHRYNSLKPRELYTFLRDDIGAECMQFLPLVETKEYITAAPGHWAKEKLPRIGSSRALPGTPDSFVMDWSVSPVAFGNCLNAIFDIWLAEDIGKVIIPFFECMLSLWSGQPSTMCTFDTSCGQALALDSDGSLYFCDRFCYSEYKLGSFNCDKLETLANSNDTNFFARLKGAVAPQCKRCVWAFACRGECPKNRFLLDADDNPGLNYLCSGLQLFFGHIDPAMKQFAQTLLGKTP